MKKAKKQRYDTAAAMRRAWSIRREAAARMSCKVGAVLMGECLKMAYEEQEEARLTSARQDRSAARVNALRVYNAWQAMLPGEQVALVVKATRGAFFGKYHSANWTDENFAAGQSFSDYTQEVWSRLLGVLDVDRLADENRLRARNKAALVSGKKSDPVTLEDLVYTVARKVVREAKSKRAAERVVTVPDLVDDNGRACAFIETVADDGESVDSKSITVADAQAFIATLDNDKRQIVIYLLRGFTERGIAERMGKSPTAIHKQRVTIRKRYKAFMEERAA